MKPPHSARLRSKGLRAEKWRAGVAVIVDHGLLPPVEFACFDAVPGQDARVAQQRHETRRMPALQFAQAGDVHVVVMIVRQQDDVRTRQIGKRDARRARAPRTCPGHRGASLAEDRIGQHHGIGQADQERRVVDEADRDAARCDGGRRWREWRVGRRLLPCDMPAVHPPPQDLQQAARLRRRAGIEEALAIAVVGGRKSGTGRTHASANFRSGHAA
jgi:hypothetical protein